MRNLAIKRKFGGPLVHAESSDRGNVAVDAVVGFCILVIRVGKVLRISDSLKVAISNENLEDLEDFASCNADSRKLRDILPVICCTISSLIGCGDLGSHLAAPETHTC